MKHSPEPKRIVISEIFGPVIQGEGPLIGRPTVFVRSGGCDSRCSWCDTPYAVLPAHALSWSAVPPELVWSRVKELAPEPAMVTLSGGNPALQRHFGDLIALGHRDGYTFTCETQATVAAPWFRLLDHLVLSPKPPSSGETCDLDSIRRCLDASVDVAASPGYAVNHSPSTALKVVILDDDDYRFAREVGEAFPSIPLYLQVCNPDGAAESADVSGLLTSYRALAERVLSDRWASVTVLPQLHVLTWGADRGR